MAKTNSKNPIVVFSLASAYIFDDYTQKGLLDIPVILEYQKNATVDTNRSINCELYTFELNRTDSSACNVIPIS